MNPLEAKDLTPTEFTGVSFQNIILGNGNDIIAKEFFDREFSNEGGNGRARRIEDEQQGIYLPISIMPRYYHRPEWLEVNGYTINGVQRRPLPTFTIASDVDVSGVDLKKDIAIANCKFLAPVKFTGITGDVTLSFSNCTFENSIAFTNVRISKLSITNTNKFFKAAISDSNFKELEFRSNHDIKLYVDNTQAELMNLSLGFNR